MPADRIIIVHRPGGFNAAATNRMVKYAEVIGKSGHETVLVMGSDDPSFLPDVPGVRQERIVWKKRHFRSLEKLESYWLILRAIRRNKVVGVTIVFTYGLPCFMYFLSRRKYKLFSEQTELLCDHQLSFYDTIRDKLRMKLSRRMDGLIVISNALKEYFSDLGVCNLTIVNMFVDQSRFVRLESSVEDYIAYCGTVSMHKDGVDILVQAFSRLHKSHPLMKLMIIGRFLTSTDEVMVKKLVNDLSLQDSVLFTGFVHSDRIPELLSKARILALARPDSPQARYGFPTKLGEYLATGRPVVVTRTGEIDKFLRDGVNCIFAKPGDSDGFAEKLCWALDHYDEACEIAGKGCELVGSAFSADVQVMHAIDFIDATISEEK